LEINRYKCSNLQPVKASKLIAYLLFSVASFNAGAFLSSNIERKNEDNKLSKTKVEYYQQDNITNQVPYFDNRFRLDAQLEEITLIFYRKSGSTPIILIRPDGSKIRVNQIDHDKVQWFDDSTFDMIKIKNPMPGPWQAVGDILPNSQILVVSEVKIVVEPLPEIAFSGETLKVKGRLFNGNEAINSPHFKKVVKLDVNFYSTNNSLYENFGADAIKVTSFRDDGRGLDEYANDNTFTGEFILNFASGEWQPVYLVKLPMATRELSQQAIILKKTPIDISVIKSEDFEIPHQLRLTIDPTFVDPNSLVFQGKFTFPDRQIEPFSIMEEEGTSRMATITNTEPGLYRVNISAFGKTIKGREFRLVVPEFSFHVETSLNELKTGENVNSETVTTVVETTDELLIKGEQDRIVALLAQKLVQDGKDQETFIIIVIGNSVVILVSVVVFFLWRWKKKRQ
jgi:uncharacterized protein (TIGR03503 family)